MKVANRDVARVVAQRSIDVDGYGSMFSRVGYDTYWGSWLPERLVAIMRERRKSIAQVIYSYNTPIAWLDAGLWIVPAVTYSPTTGKHQGYLYDLRGELIPWDCSLEEYLRVMNAQMRFVRQGRNLTTKPVV